MCLWVSLLGRVWSHASVASDPHRFRRVLLAGLCGYLYTPHTLSHPVTPGVILPITPTHRDVSTHMVQGGHHPNAWTRGGDWLVLLSSAVVAVAGEVYRVQDWELAPHSAPWEPRVHVRTRPEDPATHRATPAMLGRGGDCGRPMLFFASRVCYGLVGSHTCIVLQFVIYQYIRCTQHTNHLLSIHISIGSQSMTVDAHTSAVIEHSHTRCVTPVSYTHLTLPTTPYV